MPRINIPRINRSKSQHGAGLIEVLVSMLVFGLGILGVSSMQVTAKKTSYDAMQRSIATSLARDIVERMRSNPSTDSMAIFGAVNNIGGGTILNEPAPNCKSITCTPQQLATHDIWEWEQALDGASEMLSSTKAGGLVSPSACITHTAGQVMVTIAWQGHKEGLINPTNSSCGEGRGLYGANELNRQLIVVATYIAEI